MTFVKPLQAVQITTDALESKVVTIAKRSQRRDQVSSLVHEIDNIICGLRLHADNLSAEPQFGEAANDVFDASQRIEALVVHLASLARNPF
jgi:nitrogen-specific signal transduction histidine kinase